MALSPTPAHQQVIALPLAWHLRLCQQLLYRSGYAVMHNRQPYRKRNDARLLHNVATTTKANTVQQTNHACQCCNECYKVNNFDNDFRHSNSRRLLPVISGGKPSSLRSWCNRSSRLECSSSNSRRSTKMRADCCSCFIVAYLSIGFNRLLADIYQVP